jgi:hypothetical protein
LAHTLREHLDVIADAVARIDEPSAGRRPDRETWCANESLSHLSGVDLEFLRSVQALLVEELPFVDIEPGLTGYTPERAALGKDELLAFVQRQYGGIADLAAGLTDEQLQRRGHIPLLAQTPFGDHPTVEEWLRAIVTMHVPGHVEQLVALARANSIV